MLKIKIYNIISNKVKSKATLLFIFLSFLTLIATIFVIHALIFPQKTDAKELINLYQKLADVRKTSAETLAEYMEASEYPERIGAEKHIGMPQPLHSMEELQNTLITNRSEVSNAINQIESTSFTDPDIEKFRQDLVNFYTELADFEDRFIIGFDNANSPKEFANVIDQVFEQKDGLEKITKQDEKILQDLKTLANENDLTIKTDSYDVIFKNRLIYLDNRILGTNLKLDKESFNIPTTASRFMVLISWGPEVTLDDISVDLKAPNKNKFRLAFTKDAEDKYFKLKDFITHSDIPSKRAPNSTIHPIATGLNEVSVGKHYLLLKLLGTNPSVSPLAGNWETVVTFPEGAKVSITVNSFKN